MRPTGNDYSPANTKVLTNTDGTQLFVRWHPRGEVAPASDASGNYNLVTGTRVNFDWGITFSSANVLPANVDALITLTRASDGAVRSYNPFFLGNDNANQVFGSQRTVENSASLDFGFLFGPTFNANANDSYTFTLTMGGATRGFGTPSTLSSTVNIAAVPEPATWGMLLFGFGAMGAALRGTRKQTMRTPLTMIATSPTCRHGAGSWRSSIASAAASALAADAARIVAQVLSARAIERVACAAARRSNLRRSPVALVKPRSARRYATPGAASRQSRAVGRR